jgi:ADP-ribosylglycohydrolase
MRVSPVSFAFATLEEVLAEAKRSAEITHSHLEGIEGAQAVAAGFW